MAKQWTYTLGIVAVVIAIFGLAGLLLGRDQATAIFAGNPELPTRLGAAQLLYRQEVVIPLGPVVMAATPFQLTYVVLSICLTCLATLVCLTNCLFFHRHAPPESRSIASQPQN